MAHPYNGVLYSIKNEDKKETQKDEPETNKVDHP